MLDNRSMPRSTVIPVLAYADVGEAVDWLCATFAFTLRLPVQNHRAQLSAGDGSIVVTGRGPTDSAGDPTHSVMVRVDDVGRHHEQAVACGAHVLGPPADYPYGERQYTVEDIGGHVWTFSQSLADVDPAQWGGTLA